MSDPCTAHDEIFPDLRRGDVSNNNASLPSKKVHSTVTNLFSCLEENKRALLVSYYSVSQTTLDQVFLTIVGRHHVQEENSETS